MKAADGTLLGYDSMPLADVMPAGFYKSSRATRRKGSRKQAKDMAMTKDAKRARDFLQLASVHAGSDENACRAVIDGLDPELRSELHAIADSFAQLLKPPSVGGASPPKPGGGSMPKPGTVLDDFVGPVSAPSVMAEVERDLPVSASDAIPGMGWVSRA